ncbi:MAG: restriction endonuclease subunit S [Candidatus Pacearchaeota archaeon]|jgi:hypothetical protein
MVFRGYNQDYEIEEVFDVETGKRITEREVYQHLGNIPVVTSKSLGKGISWYAEEKWLGKQGKLFDGETITWTKEGYAGKLFYRNYKFFPIDVCGVLRLKKDFFRKVNLQWFLFSQQNNFYQNVYSKGTQGKLYQDTAKKIVFTLIDKDKQDLLAEKYTNLSKIKDNIYKILSRINSLQNKYLLIEDEKEKIPLSNILKHISRNDSLSEEGIYKRSQGLKNNKEKIIVLSGSFEDIYGIVPFNKNLHFIKDSSCLQVITRGNAGEIRFLKKDNYATNTNSMLLCIKKDARKMLNIKNEEDEGIYLKFLSLYLHPIFKENSSSADLSVFPLTEILKIVDIPKFELNQEMRKIVKDFDAINNIKEILFKILDRIDNLFKITIS